jgi:flagellar assembly protein FliH
LEYQEAGGDTLALLQASSPGVTESAPSAVVGILEDEVERRIQIAREAAAAEAGRKMRIECERATQIAQEKVSEVLRQFADERAEYFRRVESEVVQLALAITRKILQREADLDPTLLAALVRVALDRMQCGSAVRIRVTADNAELWRGFGNGNGSSQPWEITSDETLSSGDCIVETDLGTANFGFEVQLRDVQESLEQLLAHRPNDRSHHAARP